MVMEGAHRCIRHPLYSSLLFLSWGVFLKDPAVVAGTLAVGASVLLYATARDEDRDNVRKFGPEYAAYIRTSWMFIPYVL